MKPTREDILGAATAYFNDKQFEALMYDIEPYDITQPTANLTSFAETMYSAGAVAAEERIRKLEDFKSYVHQRLDAMGVPHSVPESEHDKAGCRVGGRLDWIDAALATEREVSDKLEKAVCALGVIGSAYCFCSEDRDPEKILHEPECAELRVALSEVAAIRKTSTEGEQV